jgi:hypothetical protein
MNELVLSPPSYPGFDGILVSNRSLLGVDEVFFLQMKIGDSIKNNTNSKATVLAKTIFFSVEHHLKNMTQLLDHIPSSNVHIVLYAWWDEEIFKKEEIVKAVNDLRCNDITNDIKDKVLILINGSWFEDNIHIMGKNKLDDWLIPALTVVPRLVNGIERD